MPVTVSVSDGRGGTASDTITIQCVEPPRREWKFEDVHFDFDRYTLRQEALRILDEAVKAMQSDNTLRLTIEGHTDSIGTNEYNLALGERRATSVREYLTSRGISADRLNIVSYGEERPRHDNAREETRRLNRRAALVVRLAVDHVAQDFGRRPVRKTDGTTKHNGWFNVRRLRSLFGFVLKSGRLSSRVSTPSRTRRRRSPAGRT